MIGIEPKSAQNGGFARVRLRTLGDEAAPPDAHEPLRLSAWPVSRPGGTVLACRDLARCSSDDIGGMPVSEVLARS
jgi:hypothetical protein